MFINAKKHNNKRMKNKRTDLNMGKRLNTKFLYKLKVFRNLIKVVFKFKFNKLIFSIFYSNINITIVNNRVFINSL